MEEALDGWIEALKTLDADPSAVVRCPENGDGVVAVQWLPATPDLAARGELLLRCPVCGATRHALYAQRPERF